MTSTPDVGRRRRVVRGIGLLLAVFVLVTGVSVGRALSAPGTDSTSARLAEWARGHGLSAVVDRLERLTYQPPKVGGRPAATSPLAGGPIRASSALVAVQPLASPALPGEGVWRTLAATGAGPVLQVAYLRPDPVHTSYTAAAVWMDTAHLRFVLHPGTQEPGGGPWREGPAISAAERPVLLAAFNGGFRLDAARGGFFEDGRTRGSLRRGSASLVFFTDGRVTVGQWGRDVSAGGHVAAVRQNLDLIVDGGQPVPGLADNSRGRWGNTLGNKLFVWRSGVGVTTTGALVYVSGNRLSAASLAALLTRAGCVRAMELDINPEWTSFVTYGGKAEANVLPDMQRSPHRYDSVSTRDFVTVLATR